MRKVEEVLPVTIGESLDDDMSMSADEIKTSEKCIGDLYHQIMAETIVFSFLQHKQNFRKLKNYLIPGIGIISQTLIIFMYDCESDVLLSSCLMPFFNKAGIIPSSVMVLWLVLNYKPFGTGLIDEIKEFLSNIHRLLGEEKLEQYKTKVCRPFRKSFIEQSFGHSSFVHEDPKRKLESYPEDQYPIKKLFKNNKK